MKPHLIISGLIFALTGCSDMHFPWQEKPAEPVALTRALVDSVPLRVLIVDVEKHDIQAALTPAATNGAVTTWLASDKTGVSTQSGIVVNTRGLGFDLMSSEISGTLNMLQGQGPETYEIRHAFLDGEFQTVIRTAQCQRAGSPVAETIDLLDVSVITKRYVEKCETAHTAFENSYWLRTKDRLVIRSDIWINEEIGHLRASFVKD